MHFVMSSLGATFCFVVYAQVGCLSVYASLRGFLTFTVACLSALAGRVRVSPLILLSQSPGLHNLGAEQLTFWCMNIVLRVYNICYQVTAFTQSLFCGPPDSSANPTSQVVRKTWLQIHPLNMAARQLYMSTKHESDITVLCYFVFLHMSLPRVDSSAPGTDCGHWQRRAHPDSVHILAACTLAVDAAHLTCTARIARGTHGLARPPLPTASCKTYW